MYGIVQQRGKVNNWGDVINGYLFCKLSNTLARDIQLHPIPPKDWNYLMCGSILRLANNFSIVWGTGFICHDDVILSRWEPPRGKKNIYTPKLICSVRGPKTRGRLQELGIACPAIYGDPALIMPYLYTPPASDILYDYGIIPHYADRAKIDAINKGDNVNIIDIEVYNNNIFKIIDEISKCRVIFSSTLHGLILGQLYSHDHLSYHLRISNKLDGDTFKFQDYFMSINRQYKNVTLDEVVHSINNTFSPEPYELNFNYNSFIDSCPFVDKNVREEMRNFFDKYDYRYK